MVLKKSSDALLLAWCQEAQAAMDGPHGPFVMQIGTLRGHQFHGRQKAYW